MVNIENCEGINVFHFSGKRTRQLVVFQAKSIYLNKEGHRGCVNVSCSKSSTSTIATFGTYLAKRENRFRWECYHPAGFAQCLKPEDSLISRFQLGSCLRGDWMSFGIELLISESGKGNKERVRDAFRAS